MRDYCASQTRGGPRLVVVNYAFDASLDSPEHVLDTYRALSGWCRAAADAGMTVRLVQAFTRDACIEDGQVEWVFRAVSRSRSLAVRGLHAAVTEHRPDVVHVNGLDSPIQTRMLRAQLPASAAIVVQDHAGTPPRSPLKGVVRRRLMRAVDAWLFTSSGQANEWVHGGYMRSSDVFDVMAASTGLTPVDRAIARQMTGLVGTPALIWVARLDANKDPHTVLDGIERLATQFPNLTLTMIFQGGPLEDEVRRRVASSPNLVARVRLIGATAHQELAAWYSAADVFVLGSAQEVCGYALIEACACGAVPVVTDIPSFRSITGGGAIGRLWRRGDAHGLAEAVTSVHPRLDDERARVEAHFAAALSWSAVGRRARAVYETVVDRRRSAERLEGA